MKLGRMNRDGPSIRHGPPTLVNRQLSKARASSENLAVTAACGKAGTARCVHINLHQAGLAWCSSRKIVSEQGFARSVHRRVRCTWLFTALPASRPLLHVGTGIMAVFLLEAPAAHLRDQGADQIARDKPQQYSQKQSVHRSPDWPVRVSTTDG